MSDLITITGEDIVGWDGEDHTGAFAELGVSYAGEAEYAAVMTRVFEVSLDFVLRHGLIDQRIYDNHYKGTLEYLRYYNEGRDAYLAGQDEDNPHDTGTVNDPGHWNTSIYHKRYPWYDGYRETQAAAMEEKYHIKAMQAEIRAVIERHGLTVQDCDEYPESYSSAKTPQGFFVKLT